MKKSKGGVEVEVKVNIRAKNQMLPRDNTDAHRPDLEGPHIIARIFQCEEDGHLGVHGWMDGKYANLEKKKKTHHGVGARW